MVYPVYPLIFPVKWSIHSFRPILRISELALARVLLVIALRFGGLRGCKAKAKGLGQVHGLRRNRNHGLRWLLMEHSP